MALGVGQARGRPGLQRVARGVLLVLGDRDTALGAELLLVDGGPPQLAYTTEDMLLEAPNWAPWRPLS